MKVNVLTALLVLLLGLIRFTSCAARKSTLASREAKGLGRLRGEASPHCEVGTFSFPQLLMRGIPGGR